MLFNKASIVQTLADKIDSSVKDVFLTDESELEFFEDDKIAGLVNNIPGCTQDDVTEKDINKVIKTVSNEASYNPIDDIVNGGYEESLFRGMSEKAGENEDDEKLEAEEKRLKKYASTAKGKKKASYEKKIDEIEEEEKKEVKESYDSIEDIFIGW